MPRHGRFRLEMATAIRPESATDLVRSGVTRYALRTPAWTQTSRGRYVPSHAASATPTQRILEAVAAVPDHCVLTGWAGLYASGVDWLDGIDGRNGRLLPVPVNWMSTGGDRAPALVRVSRLQLEHGRVGRIAGLSVASPIDAVLDEMCATRSLAEAVVVADASAHAGLISVTQLGSTLRARRNTPGIRLARRAAVLADPAARSPWESRLRVFYVVEAGLPRPEVNKPIFDRRTGRLVGIGDLLDAEAGTVTEFDGRHHRERRQHRDDNIREEAFEELGLIVTRVDSLDVVHHRRALASRLHSARRRGLQRDRRLDRWTVEEPEWWVQQAGPDVPLTDDEKAAIFGQSPDNNDLRAPVDPDRGFRQERAVSG